ncbi:MAG: hypothetical protein AB1502_01670 [Thermodesulfobacteriota bacterium]
MKSTKRHYNKTILLLATLFILWDVLVLKIWGQDSDSNCVKCHTDMPRMKALIKKFPEPPEEEGEA